MTAERLDHLDFLVEWGLMQFSAYNNSKNDEAFEEKTEWENSRIPKKSFI